MGASEIEFLVGLYLAGSSINDAEQPQGYKRVSVNVARLVIGIVLCILAAKQISLIG